MNTERLEHLITIMQDVTILRKKFDMSSWATSNTNECGTTCCALGWAALDPKCMAEGLILQASWLLDQFESDGPRIIMDVTLTSAEAWDKTEDAMREYAVSFVPTCEGEDGFYAAMKYYDISLGQAEYLFDNIAYRNPDGPTVPQDVIEHIKQVLTDYDPGEDDYDTDY